MQYIAVTTAWRPVGIRQHLAKVCGSVLASTEGDLSPTLGRIASLRTQPIEQMNQNRSGSNQVLKPATGAEEFATQSVAVQAWHFTRGLPR